MKKFQVGPIPSGQDLVHNYRELASQCREMAKSCRRPAALLLRAAVFDEAAEYQLQDPVSARIRR